MKNTIEIVKIILLGVIAVCSIILVTQGYGGGTQDVYVRGGEIEVEGYVDIGNTVDVNLDQVLGHPVGCRKSYTIDGREFVAIDVCNRW